jgi:hypothetical protein
VLERCYLDVDLHGVISQTGSTFKRIRMTPGVVRIEADRREFF